MENQNNQIQITSQGQTELAHGSKKSGNLLMNIIKQTPPDRVPVELVRLQSNLTVEVAMKQEHQLSALKKEDQRTSEFLISLMVELIAEQFNVKETFSPLQMLDCTLSIMERFWYLRPEEILYAFKQAKLGHYGPVYNKLDSQTILTWLHKYDTEDRIRQVEKSRDAYKKAENEPQIDVHKAYLQEKVAQHENGGTPTLVVQDREKRQAEKDKRRGAVEYQAFQDNYFKKRRTEAQPETLTKAI